MPRRFSIPVLPVCLVLAAALLPATAQPIRFYLEAEDCQGLQRYPYHNEDASGWYAREANVRAYGAPGRSYYAAIHENAANRTMTRTLEEPIPPGRYRAFLRIVGPGMAEDSILNVAIGDTPVRFEWRHRGKRTAWIEGREFTLTRAARSVTFTAVQFGGSTHGALYMPLHNTIWLDTLYITADTAEETPPDIVTERCLRAGVEPDSLPPRRAHAADDDGPSHPGTPAREGDAQAEPIPLQTFDGGRNLWPNSSFELGMNDGWATDSAQHVFTDEDLSKEDPFHGTVCLRLTGNGAFGRPYRLETNGTFALSVYARGEGQTVAALLQTIPGHGDAEFERGKTVTPTTVLRAEGEAGTDWTRLSTTGTLEVGWYYLAFEQGGFCVDAVQLEAGDTATEYAPRAEVEGALRSGRLGNIIYRSEQDTLDLWFRNSGHEARDARLRYRIVDVRDRVVAEGTTDPVTLEPGTTVTMPLKILPALYGVFSVCFAVDGREGTEGETVFAVLPDPPDAETRHVLGGNMDPRNEWELAVQSRMGLKWVVTCKSRYFGAAAEGAHPKPGVWNWFDEAATRPAEYGMTLHPALWPGRIPAFMQTEPDRVYRSVRASRGPRQTVPDMALWKEHVAKVVRHYRDDIEWWCIDDECEGPWDPSLFAPYVEATAATAKNASPRVKIGFSGGPAFQEEVLQFVSPDRLDFFGSSTFDMHYWEARRVRHISERYGKPFICYGVGLRPPPHTMYHTSYYFLPPYGKAARMARRVINLLLVQDLLCAGHYAAVFRNYGGHYGLNKPLCDYDGTPLPWGGTFACLGTLLADAVPVDHLPLGNTDHLAHMFRVGDRYGFTTYATCVADYDQHYRPAERTIPGMMFPCPRGSVDVLDMYWNPRADARWDRGVLTLDLDEEPVFILDKSLGPDGLRRMITESARPVRDCDMSMAFVPAAGDEGVELAVTIRNNTTRNLEEVVVDMRHQRTPFTAAGEWLLRMPYREIDMIPAGGDKTVRFRTVLDGRSPYEGGRVRANLHAANGRQHAMDDLLWLIPAARVEEVAVDGDLDEWQDRLAAWLAYVWTVMPMGRHQVQLYDNAQYFSYPSYRLDARAPFWTGYDARNLYLAVRLEDDQPILSETKGETLRVVIGSGTKQVAVDLAPLASGEVTVLPSGRDVTVTAQCRLQTETVHNGSDLQPAEIQPLLLEVALPWAALGIAPEPGKMIGFDLFWTDVDDEDGDLVGGTLRWAGNARQTGWMLLQP